MSNTFTATFFFYEAEAWNNYSVFPKPNVSVLLKRKTALKEEENPLYPAKFWILFTMNALLEENLYHQSFRLERKPKIVINTFWLISSMTFKLTVVFQKASDW